MVQISVRIDDEVKRSAEQVCADIGMSLSTAINIYLKKLGRERRISFEVRADPFFRFKPFQQLYREFPLFYMKKHLVKRHFLWYPLAYNIVIWRLICAKYMI